MFIFRGFQIFRKIYFVTRKKEVGDGDSSCTRLLWGEGGVTTLSVRTYQYGGKYFMQLLNKIEISDKDLKHGIM